MQRITWFHIWALLLGLAFVVLLVWAVSEQGLLIMWALVGGLVVVVLVWGVPAFSRAKTWERTSLAGLEAKQRGDFAEVHLARGHLLQAEQSSRAAIAIFEGRQLHHHPYLAEARDVLDQAASYTRTSDARQA